MTAKNLKPADYLKKILNARVYDVATESGLEIAQNLSQRLKNTVLLKREDQQAVHSFKLRGAYNKMAHLTAAQLKKGVICASAGNHAQGVALGASPETFMGLAGAGDLILTCTGQYSRNREVGLQLASGKTLADILQHLGHVAEGVNTTTEVMRRAKALQVDMPITHEVDQVLSHGKSAKDAVMALLGREQKAEGH